MRAKLSTAVLTIVSISTASMLFQACSGCKKEENVDLLKPDSASQVDMLKKYEQTLPAEQQPSAGLIKREYVGPKSVGVEAPVEGTKAKTSLADPYEEMEPYMEELERKITPVIDRAWRQTSAKGYVEFTLTVDPNGNVSKLNLTHSDVDAQTMATVKSFAKGIKFKPHDPATGSLDTPKMKFLSP
ncbi:MAG: hypothetical protein HGB19_08845 [Chlorobiales bacterium]|jgi:hypothetical protein|nr:hypothetical protein [Chlorobiales bacterium]